jgi:cysteine synthase A
MNIIPVLGLLLAILSCCYASRPLSAAPSYAKNTDRSWRNDAIEKMWAERKDMAHTPLVSFEIKGMPYLDLRFKDESASRSGNLKHRFSWALFMWALTEGYINKNTTVYEASSGNTATSEAYMANIIGVPFVAVVPDTTEEAKINNIRKYKGQVEKADISGTFKEAERLAKENDGFYMNQFGNADRAEEYHDSGGSNFESVNVFHEILLQLKAPNNTPPHFFVHTAGTGGTISSVGRYVQKYQVSTEVVLADTQYSMYYDYVINDRFNNENDTAVSFWVKPGMAGTGYGYAGPGIRGSTTSLLPTAIDRAYKVPDLASTAAMHVLKENNIKGGTSTGLNFITSLSLGATEKSVAPNSKLIIVTLLCDHSDLYESSYYNLTWIEKNFEKHGGIKIFNCWKEIIKSAMETGFDPLEEGNKKCKVESTSTDDTSKIPENTTAAQTEANDPAAFTPIPVRARRSS